MLRESSERHDEAVELKSIMDGDVASGVPHGAALLAFSEAVVARDHATIGKTRDAVVDDIGEAAMVDVAGVISNFERMVRIADATGIGLGRFEDSTAEIRESLGIEAFRHHD